ncbi:MAG TPA: apolipoprotein N-acyltransferase [Vicinamibacterales bacterium]|nr:apolipoprotein N-acyltransferase [Vicinamibacterales bacterium]
MPSTTRVTDYTLAVVSGLLLALSFPKFGQPAFAWIALAPLLLALTGWHGGAGRISGQPPLHAFLLGLATGVVYFVGTIYWTGTVIETFGEVPMVLAYGAMLLLALYLALFPAFTALVTGRLLARGGLAALWFAPAAWVTTEFCRGWLFGGFPWVPLGNSQVTVLPVAQLASLVGVYGLSLLVAFVNTAIVYALLARGRARAGAIAVAAVVLLTVGGWGTWRLAHDDLVRQGTPIRVGLVQGNIEQTLKWNPNEARRIFTTYIAMTRDVVKRGAQYVIWPESSTPFMFEEDPGGQAALRALAREVGTPILFGSDQMVHGAMPALYNAAFLLGADGRTDAVYRKIHLVPFGEFIPLQRYLTFVSPLVDSLLDFSAGDAVVMLPVDGHLTSTAICYEVVYPSLIDAAVDAGSQLLTTITNDAWYGHSSAPYQHWEMASMRAIEQGRYMARAANTGISGIVDPYGRVVERSALFTEAGLVGEVRFLTDRTLYSRIGDALSYACIALTALGLIVIRNRV